MTIVATTTGSYFTQTQDTTAFSAFKLSRFREKAIVTVCYSFMSLYFCIPPNTETLKTCQPKLPRAHCDGVSIRHTTMENNVLYLDWQALCLCIKVSIHRHSVVLSYTFTATHPICIEAVWRRKPSAQKEMETMWVRLGSYFCVIVWPEKKKENKLTLWWQRRYCCCCQWNDDDNNVVGASAQNNQNNNNNNCIMSTKRKLLNGKWI